MGLDMYFYVSKQDYASEYAREGEVKPLIEFPKDLKPLEDYISKREYKSRTIETSYKIGYFRKFNALHHYIVEHFAEEVDDCRPIHLFKNNIEQILSALYKAKEGKTEYLPTQSGFFFGSTEYDEWYFKDVGEAIKLFEIILKTVNFETYYITYESSW